MNRCDARDHPSPLPLFHRIPDIMDSLTLTDTCILFGVTCGSYMQKIPTSSHISALRRHREGLEACGLVLSLRFHLTDGTQKSS